MGILDLHVVSLLLVCTLVYASSGTYEGNYALSFDGFNDFVAYEPSSHPSTILDMILKMRKELNSILVALHHQIKELCSFS
jgi:hypothetical protein